MSSANEHSDRRLLLSNIIIPNTGRKTGERGREGMLTGRWRERMTYCKKNKLDKMGQCAEREELQFSLQYSRFFGGFFVSLRTNPLFDAGM